ncbi:MAG: phosphoribosylformylglycinamidine synthase subunit PurS [Pseudomonadota bacterium]
MLVKVHVMLKDGVLDPQGEAVRHALDALGFDGIDSVRQGKVIELELSESDPEKARHSAMQMCEKLLANTVIESYRIDLG